MHQLIYLSRALHDFASDELVGLLQRARPFNREHGLTEVLVYWDCTFLQLLEGEPGAIAAAMARIRRDPRHDRLIVLCDAPARRRICPDWGIGFVHLPFLDRMRIAGLQANHLDELRALLAPADEGPAATILRQLIAHNPAMAAG